MDHKWLASTDSVLNQTIIQRRNGNFFRLTNLPLYFATTRLPSTPPPPRDLLLYRLNEYHLSRAREIIRSNYQVPIPLWLAAAASLDMDSQLPSSSPNKGPPKRKSSAAELSADGSPETKRQKQNTGSPDSNSPQDAAQTPRPANKRSRINEFLQAAPPPQHLARPIHHGNPSALMAPPIGSPLGLNQQNYLGAFPPQCRPLPPSSPRWLGYDPRSSVHTAPCLMSRQNQGQTLPSMGCPLAPASQQVISGQNRPGHSASMAPSPVSGYPNPTYQPSFAGHSSSMLSRPLPGSSNVANHQNYDRRGPSMMPPPAHLSNQGVRQSPRGPSQYPTPAPNPQIRGNRSPVVSLPRFMDQRASPLQRQLPQPLPGGFFPSSANVQNPNPQSPGLMPPPSSFRPRFAPEVPAAAPPSQEWRENYSRLPVVGSELSEHMNQMMAEMEKEKKNEKEKVEKEGTEETEEKK